MNMRIPVSPILAPGTIVETNRLWYNHVGIVMDYMWAGEIVVMSISGRPGHQIEQRFSEFTQGKSWKVRGYPSTLPPEVVLLRARQAVAKPYSLLKWNCEHFVAWAHGLVIESPQLQFWGVIGGLGLAAVFLAGVSE